MLYLCRQTWRDRDIVDMRIDLSNHSCWAYVVDILAFADPEPDGHVAQHEKPTFMGFFCS